jgi:hypothetical protein
MIRLVIAGLWICLVTVASSYAAMTWKGSKSAEAATQAEPEKFFGGLEQVKTRVLSVPVVADGAIQGYIVAQFSFVVGSKLLKQLSIKPEAVLLDEAFRTLYAGEDIDFRKLKKLDLTALSTRLTENVNKRFGAPFVQDVMIHDLNFVAKSEARGASEKDRS